MSYTGNDPVTQSFVAGTDYFNGDGATTFFTLSREVNSVNDIEVLVDNVELSPLVYSVLGNTLQLMVAPPVGTFNIVVRYLTTVLFQNLTQSNQGIGYLYNLIDTSVSYKATVSAITATYVVNSTQLATNTTGLSVGTFISSSQANFTAVKITAVTSAVFYNSVYTLSQALPTPAPNQNTFVISGTTPNPFAVGSYVAFSQVGGSATYRVLSSSVGASTTTVTVTPNITDTVSAGSTVYYAYLNVLTVSSTAQWGATSGSPTNPLIYTWSLPNNNLALVYNQTTQKWQAGSFTAVVDTNTNVYFGASNLGSITSGSNNLAIGSGNLSALTTGSNNLTLGINAGNALTTGSNQVIVGNFSGYVTNADPTKSLDLRTTSNAYITLSDTSGNVRGVCDNLGRWGLGTTTPKAILDINGMLRMSQGIEKVTITNTALSSIYAYNVNNGGVLFFTSNATGNFGFNFIGDGSASYTGSINNLLQVGDSLTVAIITTQGATAYYNSTVPQIDGSALTVTIKWQGPLIPSFGSVNGYDVYVFNIIKTASTPAYSILASRTQFGG